MSLNIEIKTIPAVEQRYPTCGDYFEEDGVEKFRITDVGNEDYEALVAIHELIEKVLCKKVGVTDQQIDDFDMQFEKDREAGLHTEDEEPGNDPKAPYYRQHQIGVAIEHLLAMELGVNWEEYNRVVMEA